MSQPSGYSANSLIIPTPVVILPDAAYSVLVSNNGALHVVPTITANRIITMPPAAAAAGCIFRFKFLSKAAFSITVTCPGGTLCGTILNALVGGGTGLTATNDASLVRSGTANDIAAGDWAEFYCDGTKYYISGACGCGDAAAGAAGYSFA